MGKNIVLIGLPGSGKSTVGQLLAEKLGRPFLDTDAMAERGRAAPSPRSSPPRARRIFAIWKRPAPKRPPPRKTRSSPPAAASCCAGRIWTPWGKQGLFTSWTAARGDRFRRRCQRPAAAGGTAGDDLPPAQGAHRPLPPLCPRRLCRRHAGRTGGGHCADV